MAEIDLPPDVAEQLKRLPRPIQTRMLKLLERLRDWPNVSRAKPLRHERAGGLRLRTGDYRLQFHVSPGSEGDIVTIEKIGHRDGLLPRLKEIRMNAQMIELDRRQYVVIEREEYDRLKTLAKSAELPPLPPVNERGNYPAVEYSRATLARSIIRDRAALGMSQRQLASVAGIRFETLCRIETGKNTPSVPTIEKIDRAIEKAKADQRTKGR